MKTMEMKMRFFLFFLFILSPVIIGASEKSRVYKLNLPTDDARSKIAAACPGCEKKGVNLCGSDGFIFGKRFPRKFFRGTPTRGYFMSPPVTWGELKEVIRREQNLTKVKSYIKDRLMSLKIYAVEPKFRAVTDLGKPRNLKIKIPQKLHMCLLDNKKLWGCCVAESCQMECCEKSLGSIIITFSLYDTENAETLYFGSMPSSGYSAFAVSRKYKDGNRSRYYCHINAIGRFE